MQADIDSSIVYIRAFDESEEGNSVRELRGLVFVLPFE